ncbi:(2Fe-2S)-binding protein [Hydrogenophilus thiooxidans]|uniref:(2Fe-2S)-binding protein n=1 Tax=Hydrogenophilus thiooxidans TaxID=2820326 RepID=UPI001C216153
MYACICFAVKEREVREAVSKGVVRMSDLCAKLGIGTRCGRCVCALREIVREETKVIKEITIDDCEKAIDDRFLQKGCGFATLNEVKSHKEWIYER